MTKAKLSETERQAELSAIEWLPRTEGKRRTEELARRMLSMPPEPHAAMAKKAKRPTKKK